MVIETQINKEKLIVARKYESVTTLSQNKNMSTQQQKVFDSRIKNTDFPPNFWLGKHPKDKPLERQTSQLKRKLRALSNSDMLNRVDNIPNKELLSKKKGGLSRDGSEIALQFFQYQDQLPPRQVVENGIEQMKMPIPFNGLAQEPNDYQINLNELRIASTRRKKLID